MDPEKLVEHKMRDVPTLLAELQERGFPMEAAFWAKDVRDGKWSLYVVSPLVDSVGLIKAYAQLGPLVRAMPQPLWVEDDDITLLGPSNPIAQDALRATTGSPRPRFWPLPSSFRQLGPLCVEEAYFYQLPQTMRSARR